MLSHIRDSTNEQSAAKRRRSYLERRRSSNSNLRFDSKSFANFKTINVNDDDDTTSKASKQSSNFDYNLYNKNREINPNEKPKDSSSTSIRIEKQSPTFVYNNLYGKNGAQIYKSSSDRPATVLYLNEKSDSDKISSFSSVESKSSSNYDSGIISGSKISE